MKQEPTESPSSAALASRIAQYSYGTPSPNGGRKGTPVKREPGPSVSPHFTRRRASVLSPTVSLDSPALPTAVRSPHFSKPDVVDSVPGRGTNAACRQEDVEDDLESIDSGSGSRTKINVDHDEEVGYEYESDGLGNLISDDSEDEEETVTPSRQSQTRIQARRAGRTERHLVQQGQSSAAVGKKRNVKKEGDEGSGTPRKKRARGYAAPEMYQHLRPLPDLLASNLDVVFCGINPGVRSSTTGHHFGHPTNKFWRSLHQSGMTSRLIKPEEDHLLLTEYNYGLTVLVDRPTAEQSELSTQEMRLNVLPFTEKLLNIKPGVVCFVGKKIWDVYESVISKSARMTLREEVIKDEVVEEVEPVPGVQAGLTSMEEQAPGQEDTKPVIADTTVTPRRQKTLAKSKETFDWTKPRPYRLPHQTDVGMKYTYFWVVPNTSGLERTPLAEQIVLFRHLKDFDEDVKAGRVVGAVKNIDIEGVKETVQGLKNTAEARLFKQE